MDEWVAEFLLAASVVEAKTIEILRMGMSIGLRLTVHFGEVVCRSGSHSDEGFWRCPGLETIRRKPASLAVPFNFPPRYLKVTV